MAGQGHCAWTEPYIREQGQQSIRVAAYALFFLFFLFFFFFLLFFFFLFFHFFLF
ncbi:hypothetical protein [Neoaquamicrobium sediminum]|uniref:hypothetical protein n=1 Tax=Neoaquamicrobium sediminum TaxID=1849104 RepID=UPI0040350917